jgi:hypothetical protein
VTAPVIQSGTFVKNVTFAANPVVLVPKPTGLAVGDLLVVHLFSLINSAGGGTDTAPAGWTAGPISRVEANAGNEAKAATFWKIATATETAASSFSFTRGTNGGSSYGTTAHCIRVTGHDPTTPFPDTAAYNTTADNQTTLTFPAITTGGVDRTVVYSGASFSNGTTNGSSWPTIGPSGTTIVSGCANNTGGVDGLMTGLAYKTQATAATVGSTTVAINVSNDGPHIGFTYAIAAPSSSSSPGTAAGTGAASAVGGSLAGATSTLAGVGAASAVGKSNALSTASATGTGAASATGGSLSAATASAAGVGSATAVGAGGFSQATSAGIGVASAVGGSLAAATATLAGVGTASSVGGSLILAVASAAGVGAASSVGASLSLAIATAAGVGFAVATNQTAGAAETNSYGAFGWYGFGMQTGVQAS